MKWFGGGSLRRTPLDLSSVRTRHEYAERVIRLIRALNEERPVNCLKSSPARCPKAGRCRLGSEFFRRESGKTVDGVT